MVQDVGWKEYLSDDERFADIINGIGCNGRQVVTFILYSGTEPWDGPKTLYEILEFTDIPKELRKLVSNYKINLIEIRKLQDTSVFQTDVRQVFDFIRCSEDKMALRELVDGDTYYKNMAEDAFNVAVRYTDAAELIAAKDYRGKDGKVDMCRALREMIEDGRAEGRTEGRTEGIIVGREEKTRSIVANMIRRGMTDEDIMALAECEQELVDEVRKELLSQSNAASKRKKRSIKLVAQRNKIH